MIRTHDASMVAPMFMRAFGRDETARIEDTANFFFVEAHCCIAYLNRGDGIYSISLASDEGGHIFEVKTLSLAAHEVMFLTTDATVLYATTGADRQDILYLSRQIPGLIEEDADDGAIRVKWTLESWAAARGLQKTIAELRQNGNQKSETLIG